MVHEEDSPMEDSVYIHHDWLEDDAEEESAQRRTGGLAGIVIVLLLLIGGLFLIKQLHTASAIQDCVMSGRSDCDVLVTGRIDG
jgi:hypothetical protein